MGTTTILAAFLLAGTVLLAGATATTPQTVIELGNVAAQGGFFLPAGSKVIGYATDDGGFRLAAVPLDTPAPVPTGAATGFEPGYDCQNDVPGTEAPLTANAVASVVPRIAALGECTGTRGLYAPVNYFEFHATGDNGGGITLSSWYGHLEVSCAGRELGYVGVGVEEHWTTAIQGGGLHCRYYVTEVVPSRWHGPFTGGVGNWNLETGTAYGFALASGLY